METADVREDEEDAKEAEEARQEPGERVSLEEYVQRPCMAKIAMNGDLGDAFFCELTGAHTAHMTRGEREDIYGVTFTWKLIWEVQG